MYDQRVRAQVEYRTVHEADVHMHDQRVRTQVEYRTVHKAESISAERQGSWVSCNDAELNKIACKQIICQISMQTDSFSIFTYFSHCYQNENWCCDD